VGGAREPDLVRRALLALALAAACAGCDSHEAAPPAAAPAEPDPIDAAAGAGGIWGTAWRLEDLAGAGALDGAEATLEFPEQGRVVGRGSCNRFFALVAVSGDSMRFSGIGATRMACEEPLATQETKYFKALESAEHFAIEGDRLVIHSSGLAEPLRFARASR
jgi:heat shock protein HslJ